jgi:hypothetical protein
VRAIKALTGLPGKRAAPLPVGLARIGVGAAAVIEAFEVSSELRGLADPTLLKLPRFAALPAIPPGGVNLLLGIWLIAALAFCLGWRVRVAGAVLVALLAYTLLLDYQLYSNHLWLLTILIFLLSLADSGAAASVDARRRGRVESIPAWPVLLMRVQLSIVYGFAALAKLNFVYLSGLVLRVQLRVPGVESLPPWFFALLAVASVSTEAFLAAAFWSRRLRPLAFVVGIGFHLTILATMRVIPDLITFALLMGSVYLTFFSAISDEAERAPGRSEETRSR